MPTIIPVVSVGHHVPDLNGHELMDLLVLLKGNISLIRQVTIITIIPLVWSLLNNHHITHDVII